MPVYMYLVVPAIQICSFRAKIKNVENLLLCYYIYSVLMMICLQLFYLEISSIYISVIVFNTVKKERKHGKQHEVSKAENLKYFLLVS